MKKKSLGLTLSLLLLLLPVFSSCNNVTNEEEGFSSMFEDKKYERGFTVSSEIENDLSKSGRLDYGGEAKESPRWRVAQWNCYQNNLLENPVYTKEASKHSYFKNGNGITADVKSGTLGLYLTTSNEYGQNGITSNPRKYGQPWPTLLVDYTFLQSEILKISDQKKILMNIDFQITKLEDKMPTTAIDSLHSYQFQWFITAQNRNSKSKDFGKYIWFGLSFLDRRYDYPPLYAAEDGGKEENTGMFIYMPDMKPILNQAGLTKCELNKRMDFSFDVLPHLREAFTLAKSRNYLLNTMWEDLYIGAANIGWEVTGTYDVAAEIYSADILYQ